MSKRKLTKAAHCVVRAEKFLFQAREALAKDVEAYNEAHPFEMSGLNSVDHALSTMLGCVSAVTNGLREAGLWKESE